MSMGNISTNPPPPTGPTGGFSNLGGAGNLGTTTSGVLLEQCNQLKSQYETLSAQMKELESKGEDTSVKLSGMTFASMIKFVVYHNKYILGDVTSGGEETLSNLHVCFTDASALLAMAHNDKDGLTVKEITTLQTAAWKNNHASVNSMIVEGLFSNLLPECFGKSSASVEKSSLPVFKKFRDFDT